MNRSLALAMLFLVPVVSEEASENKCVLPVADNQGYTSPFNLEGVISRLKGDEITVRVPATDSAGDRTLSVRLETTTSMFTIYGGFVDRTQLQAGQHVRIWLKDCGRGGRPQEYTAAVVQLASKNPGDTFP